MSTYAVSVAHLDANYFYGQIEAILRPDIRGKAFIVGGDQESRKGIVLTKSPPAKAMGVKTGNSIMEALKVCPNLIILPANYPLYQYFSERMRDIVLQHTDTIRPFGSDEMWCQLYGDRKTVMKTVQEIRRSIWRQLCLTVSIGVGDNLPYSKIGSDLAPENGVCELWTEDKDWFVYPLPVGDLLYVGPSTNKAFNRHGIYTIGDLAKSTPERVCEILKCKTGSYLWTMANGEDRTPVAHIDSDDDIKSIGNSNTMPYDLTTYEEVQAAFYMLSDSVSQRMREGGFNARTISISVKDNDRFSYSKQMKLTRPTCLAAELVPTAMELFRRNNRNNRSFAVRSLGIRGSDLVPQDSIYQLSLHDNEERLQKLLRLESTVDRIKGRFGKYSIQRAVLMQKKLKSVNANNDNDDAPIFYKYR